MSKVERAERMQAEAALIDELRVALRGEVIDRAHPAYDYTRMVWNGLIDRRPAVIARCADTNDVVAAVRVARKHRPVLSVRGGGHQVAGSAVCDDGLVIDVSLLRDVAVDPVARTAGAAGGARWADVDRATQAFGLATPGGEVSATGVAGLTLGGGIGATMRAYGLSCDNLRSVEIVTADGTLRTASRDEHPDLFWALRGGGRGLGVVTAFEFELHPLGPEVACALLLYPYEDAEGVLRAWRDYASQAPDEVTPEVGLWSIPPLPELPEDLHGEPVVFVAGLYAGPPREAAPVLAPLRQLGDPLVDLSATGPYVEAQSALDDLFPSGGRYYWKSHFLDELSDAAIATTLEHAALRPTPDSVVYIRTLGGAIASVGANETAYAHRSAAFNVSVDAIWSQTEDDEAAIAWARSTWDALRPHATGGIYLNFAGLGEDGMRRAALGSNEERLERIRRAYDPDGLFETAARQP
ncbi:MAG TPA: FAD-binding oxidoreductase [Solirubrobacteraceae bacterium]|nr:FAD-binding oxidoreductase [Solirubrobacteraceae bacterium]